VAKRDTTGEDARKKRDTGIAPAYLTWEGLADYSSCSKRWLQSHVPHSLRFKVDGKLLVRVKDFDAWIEQYREGQDLDRMLEEVLGGSQTLKSSARLTYEID